MSLPSAPAPVAVLVLAWDETTPAVRALVAAPPATGPAFESVVVLVPAGPAAEELTTEEFLPLADSLFPVVEVAEAAEDNTAPTSEPVALLPLEAELAPAAIPPAATVAETPAAPSFQPAPPASPRPLAVTAAASQPAVRVLRLSEFSLADLADYAQQPLPAPTWIGATSSPAIPYLGSVTSIPSSPAVAFSLAASAPSVVPAALPALPAAGLADIASAAPTPDAATSLPAIGLPLALAPDAEADTASVAPALAFDTETSTTELSEAAADELTETFSVDVTPVQAGWPEALASLQEPAAVADTGAKDSPHVPPIPELADTAAEAIETSSYSALLPRAASFDAPNLNFQIIQYARFAVPLALSAEFFTVLYAPAWPTWLAAQELRQRLHCPLVLHVSTLAAAAEPLALAAGWPAEIQRQALHRADLILTETPALAHRLRRELDLPAHRVRPVPAADALAVAQALSTAQLWPARQDA